MEQWKSGGERSMEVGGSTQGSGEFGEHAWCHEERVD